MTPIAMITSFGLSALGVLMLIVNSKTVELRRFRVLSRRRVLTVAGSIGCGIAIWWMTGWVVVGVTVGVGSAWMLGRRNTRRPVRDDRVFVDALATWIEQLRDTLAGAHGLEEAIRATAPRAPRSVHQEVQRLAAHMTYGSTAIGLRRFADELDHPTADFVVSALLTATQHQARDLNVLLTHVAECARDEGRMRSRVWVSRARTRSSVRIIAGVVVVFVGGLFIFSADYLSPYATAGGQVVLLAIGTLFALALALMNRLSELTMPDRFVRRREST
jgi:tight adherence protein B